MPRPCSRRAFLRLAGSVAALSAGPVARPADAPPRRPVMAFSKPFRTLDPDATAELCATVGWDGLEVPVRQADTQIAPARAEEELPRLVDALARRGRSVLMITTDITRPGAEAERLLRLAARLGIRRYRTGWLRYAADRPPGPQLAGHVAALRELAALNREVGITGGYQNHSGNGMLGAGIWDLWEALREIDPQQLGVCFDIAHATIEGGLSWPTEARLMAPHFTAVFVKDFLWEKTNEGARMRWVPLGEGMVSRGFFRSLEGAGFTGPISYHCEHPLPEGREAQIELFRRDLATLRGWLAG